MRTWLIPVALTLGALAANPAVTADHCPNEVFDHGVLVPDVNRRDEYRYTTEATGHLGLEFNIGGAIPWLPVVNPWGQRDPHDHEVRMTIVYPDGMTVSDTYVYGGGIARWDVPPGNVTLSFELAHDPGRPATYEFQFATNPENGICQAP